LEQGMAEKQAQHFEAEVAMLQDQLEDEVEEFETEFEAVALVAEDTLRNAEAAANATRWESDEEARMHLGRPSLAAIEAERRADHAGDEAGDATHSGKTRSAVKQRDKLMEDAGASTSAPAPRATLVNDLSFYDFSKKEKRRSETMETIKERADSLATVKEDSPKANHPADDDDEES